MDSRQVGLPAFTINYHLDRKQLGNMLPAPGALRRPGNRDGLHHALRDRILKEAVRAAWRETACAPLSPLNPQNIQNDEKSGLVVSHRQPLPGTILPARRGEDGTEHAPACPRKSLPVQQNLR
jgi:hypothetical protein